MALQHTVDKIIHAVNVRVKVYNWTVYTVMRTLQNALVIANPCLGENNFLLMKNVIYSTVLSLQLVSLIINLWLEGLSSAGLLYCINM